MDNVWELHIQFDGEVYEQVFDYEPFSITTKTEGKMFTKSVDKIVIFDNLAENRQDATRLWNLRDATNVMRGQIYQNGIVAYDAELSMSNSEFDRRENTCSLQFLSEETDYVQLLKENDFDIELGKSTLRGSFRYHDDWIYEEYWTLYDFTDFGILNFAKRTLLETGYKQPGIWDGTKEYKQHNGIQVGGTFYEDLYSDVDIVRQNLKYYICIADNTNKKPSENPEYWSEVGLGIFSWQRTSTFIKHDTFDSFGAFPDTYESDMQYMAIGDEINTFDFARVIYTFAGRMLDYDILTGDFIDVKKVAIIFCSNLRDILDEIAFKIYETDSDFGRHFEELYQNDKVLDVIAIEHIANIPETAQTLEVPTYSMKASSFLQYMKQMFNIDVVVDTRMRLKHPTDFKTTPDNNVDLYTTTKSTQNYKNRPKNVAIREEWKYLDINDGNTNKAVIKYKSIGDEIPYDLSECSNNFFWLISNPDAPSSGFCIVSKDFVPIGSTEQEIIRYADQEILKPNQLLIDNMLYERPQPQGEIEGELYSMDTSKQKDLGQVRGKVGQLNNITTETGINTVLTEELGSTAFIQTLKMSTDNDYSELTIVL